ncbi:MAG TPA: glycine cleavage system aminomethyltransferase GcvT [Pirellulales bacterium]|nr:glycine cleavage system aminomethyltransferase GcvT [Pirellulales bacterium]
MVTSSLAQTPLHDWHAAHGGRMVDFAGWSMPVQYSSIVAEHTATRTAAGLFDVSHMGRLQFTGTGVAQFLDSLVTRRITEMEIGQVRYALVTNEQGGILDDVLVYRLKHPSKGEYHLMVVNASNREKIVDWIQHWLDERKPDVRFTDITHDTAMIAVQGPLAAKLIEPRVPFDPTAMKYYHAISAEQGYGCISRTGYTGEDGFEVIAPANEALKIWESLLDSSSQLGVMAAGLGARDTLRLEAAMPLYGHELNEQTNPLEAGLGFAVNLEGRRFPGSAALATVQREKPRRARIGLELTSKRVPREHYGIYAGDQPIGEITSGTFSPTLQKPIAMGYVPPQFAQSGTELTVDIRGSREPAHVVKLPFYKRP